MENSQNQMAEADLPEGIDWGKLKYGGQLHGRTPLQQFFLHAREWAPVAICTALWVAGLFWVGGTLGGPYVCVSILLFLCSRTSATRKGSRSAYSVFNANFEKSAGQLTSADWDREYRGGAVPTPAAEREDEAPLFGGAPQPFAGQGQVLGSGGAPSNSLMAQLARERHARQAAAAAAAAAAGAAAAKRD